MRKNLILTSLARISENRNDEVIPKGVKEYFFTESGHFFNSIPTGSYTIFYKCFALNDKNAKRKFDAYRKLKYGK
jgi:hypothetical protein